MNWTTLLLPIGIAQGLFLAAVLGFKKGPNLSARRLLALLLVFIALTMFGRLLSESAWGSAIPNLLAFPDAIIFLYGPMLYYSVAQFFSHQAPRSIIRSVHFIPVSLFILGEVGLETEWLQQALVTTIPACSTFYCWGALVEGGAIAVNAIFLVLSIRLVYVHGRASPHEEPSPVMRMVTPVVLAVLSIVLIVWFLGFLSWTVLATANLFVISYRSVWFLLVGGLYVFSFIVYFQERRVVLARMPRSSSASRPALTKFESLQARINQHMQEKQPHLDAQLNLQVLAAQLGTTPHKLSQIFNEGYGVGYADFIQQHRIDAFKRLVQQGRHQEITLLAMAYEAGFNAKSTFYAAFRKATGMTPSAYVKAWEQGQWERRS